MVNQRDREISSASELSDSEGEVILGPGTDGMGRITALEAIDKKLRKKLLTRYDLVELVNRGRYYTAKAYSKDGRRLSELLIDKQTGNIQVVCKMKKK